MTRNVKITFCVFATFLVAAAPGQHNDSHFCAVRLLVSEANGGEPVRLAVAELIDPSGRVIQTQTVVNGQAEFRDFAFGKHSIFIHYGESQCAATEIKNVHLMYGFTQKLHAVLNSCPDEGDVGPGTACGTYVRVSSPDGQPIPATEIKARTGNYSERTDTYGRADVSVENGTEDEFTFLHPGYKAYHLRLSCSRMSVGTKEAAVVLEPEGQNQK